MRAGKKDGYHYVSVFLHVVSASVTASPVSSTVSEGSNAQFEFVVTGNPLPTVEWYKGTIDDAFGINLGPPQLTSGESCHQCVGMKVCESMYFKLAIT